MQPHWLKMEVKGFRNGSVCTPVNGETTTVTGYLFVGTANNCPSAPGQASYKTSVVGLVWDQMNNGGPFGLLGMGTTTSSSVTY
jgi:hypothetical protein